MSDNRKIIKITNFDLLSLDYQENVIFACTDNKKLYQFVDQFNLRELNIQSILTDSDRLYSTSTNNGQLYYVWETNELWLYNGGWIIQIGSSVKPSAIYPNSTEFEYIYGQILDNNGLLGDGSVVIRDYNRLIKGKLYIDATNNDLVISSFLGGGIRFLPSGESNKYFYFNESGIQYTGDFCLMDSEYYTEYNGVRYKLWSTKDFTYDNIRSKLGLTINSIINDLEGYYINKDGKIIIKYYNNDNKLCYKDENDNQYIYNERDQKYYDSNNNEVDVLNLTKYFYNMNVKYLNGYTSDKFAFKDHKHNYSDVLVNDVNIKDYLENYTSDYMRSHISHNNHIGISVDELDNEYIFKINNKIINLTNGVSGSATLNYNTEEDCSINVTVNPDKHKHELTDSQLDGWSDFVKSIEDTYFELDSFKKFYKYLFGNDYTGLYVDSPLIVSNSSPNKLLLLDSNGNLPTNITGYSKSTKSLDKDINVSITDSTGDSVLSFVINKNLSNINSNIIINPETHDHIQYLIYNQIGKSSEINLTEITNKNDYRKIGITPLDTEGKIPLDYFPSYILDSLTGDLRFISNFDPTKGYPVTMKDDGTYEDQNGNKCSLQKGYYWIATSEYQYELKDLNNTGTIEVSDEYYKLYSIDKPSDFINLTETPIVIDANFYKSYNKIRYNNSYIYYELVSYKVNNVVSDNKIAIKFINYSEVSLTVLGGQEYLNGDWIIYNDNNNWIYLDNSGSVESVNGQSGRVEITIDNINGISKDMLFDFNNPETNKILLAKYGINHGRPASILDCDITGRASAADSSDTSLVANKLSHSLIYDFTDQGNILGSLVIETDNNVINQGALSVSYIDGGNLDST